MGGVPEHSTAEFLASTADLARAVIEADDGWPTYDAGMRFLGLAMEALSPTVGVPGAEELPGGLYLIWGSLTDAMDAPGRGGAEQDAAAVAQMKRAAVEWLEVLGADSSRRAYLDRWVHEECGYARRP